jgi:UDP-glucuronate 4-epimerase
MRYVVTGSAGFVGSHVCEALFERAHDVDGVDAFTDYYDPSLKRANAARLARHDGFRADLDDVLTGADAVIHLAAPPGVRLS